MPLKPIHFVALKTFGSLLLLSTGLIAVEYSWLGGDIDDVEGAGHDPVKVIAFPPH